MGKIRKPRSTKNKKNIPVANSDEEEQLPVESKENVVQTMLDQLQAANVEEKYCGLQTFAMLIESPESIEEIVNKGLVKVVAPLIMDAASSVRNAAAGVLRNLSTVRHEVCDAMMDQDVMTPITMYFHEHAETWRPDPSSKNKNEDCDTLVQCTNLLLNLCENSELAIKYLGQSRILDILPRYLNIETFGAEIVTAVLQCLFVVVEDNPLAMEKIKLNAEMQLQSLLALEGNEPSVQLMKTLAAGVIINTCGGDIQMLPANITNQIITILANTLSIDHRLASSQLSSNLPLQNGSGKIEPLRGKAAETLEKEIKSLLYLVDAQQSSIEIIANICSSEDCDDSEGGESSDSEELIEDEVCTNTVDTVYPEDKLSATVIEALVSLGIFEKVWMKTQPPAENVMLILKEYEGSQLLHKKLINMQSGALLCINNMVAALPIDDIGGINGVYKMWVEAGKLVFKQNSDKINLLESATAVMRAALDKIKIRENDNACIQNLLNEIALSDIEIMLTGIRECQVPEIRSNLIRMIGLLALLLVNNLNETTSNVICTITDFILDQAHKENEVWVLAEAIDTVVDLYSEDETDILAAKVKLPEKLAVLAPIIKNKARQQKRLPKEYKVLVSTAISNLPRFIKYKKERVSKL